MRHRVSVAALLCGLSCHSAAHSQILNPLQSPTTTKPSSQTQIQSAPNYDPLARSGYQISPFSQPTFTPGIVLLMELETKFAASVAEGGGKAFSSWFADDAVSLANGKPPVMGKAAIASQANWDPKEYQLTWIAQGAQMGPSNDMGFTWGHYDASFKDPQGQPVKLSGRYMTMWKKVPDGAGPGAGWKVALESSADEPPDSGNCCTLPNP